MRQWDGAQAIGCKNIFAVTYFCNSWKILSQHAQKFFCARIFLFANHYSVLRTIRILKIFTQNFFRARGEKYFLDAAAKKMFARSVFSTPRTHPDPLKICFRKETRRGASTSVVFLCVPLRDFWIVFPRARIWNPQWHGRTIPRAHKSFSAFIQFRNMPYPMV